MTKKFDVFSSVKPLKYLYLRSRFALNNGNYFAVTIEYSNFAA